MKRFFFLFVIIFSSSLLNAGILKSVVYDFDGFDDGMTELPEGDYHINDLTYKATPTPFSSNDILGDKVLQLDLKWNSGNGSFGRGISRFIEFDPTQDVFNFYFCNSTSADASFDVILSEDDDASNDFSILNDDEWVKNFSIPAGNSWQLISVPLSEFTDSNSGGDGIFNCSFEGGMLLFVEFKFKQNAQSNQTFFLDMICFSEGELPHGATVFDLPPLSMQGKCPLGAYEKKIIGQQFTIPNEIESFFSESKKIKYVNWFVQWAMDGSTNAHELPGDEVSKLLLAGYHPVITWEALYKGFDRLDPIQPRLDNILNGEFDAYINSFADKIKSYNDTIVIRFLHEFEGDWYPWSITYNNHNPQKYISAFRKVVDMFRARGAAKVKWMWCVNSDYAPYQNYNWNVKAYPGDNYVDVVATDIYNNHFPVGSPWWFSFRYKAAESYYYLSKYFPQKPLWICEEGCRERSSSENLSSQSKSEWVKCLNKEMQSNFSRAKTLIFFSDISDGCDWRINSTSTSLSAIEKNIWMIDYYFEDENSHIHNIDYADGGFIIYPNPTSGLFTMEYCFHDLNTDIINVEIINETGKKIFEKQLLKGSSCGREVFVLSQAISRGLYTINVIYGDKQESKRVILSYDKKTKASGVLVQKSVR